MEDNSLIKIRKHFLALGVLPAIIFLCLVVLALSWVGNTHQTNVMQSHLNHSYSMFYGELYEEARIIKALSDQITEREEIQDAFMANNRGNLLKIVQPVFKRMRTDYDITHCYFHSLDRTIFLRGHFPGDYGDIIDRYTLKEAERTGSVSYGLELGTMGTLTLRVVLPWRINGQLVGFVELGKRIDNIIDEMKKIIEVDLMLVVNKQHLDKEIWGGSEYGQGDLVVGDWDQFPDVVVFGNTLPRVPTLLNEDLARAHDMHKDILMEINIDGRKFLAGFAPLFDASDKDIGDMIIIKDFTDLKDVETRLIFFVLIGCVFCILIYMGFVFFYLGRIDRN